MSTTSTIKIKGLKDINGMRIRDSGVSEYTITTGNLVSAFNMKQRENASGGNTAGNILRNKKANNGNSISSQQIQSPHQRKSSNQLMQPRSQGGSMYERMQTNAQKLSEKKIRFKNRLNNLGKMDFSSTVAYGSKEGTMFSPQIKRGNGVNQAKIDYKLYNTQNYLNQPYLSQLSIEMQKINNENIQGIQLDKDLQSFKSVGPVFEGMPHVRYTERPLDWFTISKEVLSHYAPHLPFKYLSQEKESAFSSLYNSPTRSLINSRHHSPENRQQQFSSLQRLSNANSNLNILSKPTLNLYPTNNRQQQHQLGQRSIDANQSKDGKAQKPLNYNNTLNIPVSNKIAQMLGTLKPLQQTQNQPNSKNIGVKRMGTMDFGLMKKQTVNQNMKFAQVRSPIKEVESKNNQSAIRLKLIGKYTSDINVQDAKYGKKSQVYNDCLEAEEKEFFFLSMKQFLQFQARRKSCHCTCCGGELRNEGLRKKSEYIDAEVALINQLSKVKQQKAHFKDYLLKDITKKVQEFTKYKQVRDSLKVLSKEEILNKKFAKFIRIPSPSRRSSRFIPSPVKQDPLQLFTESTDINLNNKNSPKFADSGSKNATPQKRMLTEPMAGFIQHSPHVNNFHQMNYLGDDQQSKSSSQHSQFGSGVAMKSSNTNLQRMTQSTSPRLELVKSKTIMIKESLDEYNQALSPQYASLVAASTTKHKSIAFNFKEPMLKININQLAAQNSYQQTQVADIKDVTNPELHLHHLKPYLQDIKRKKSQAYTQQQIQLSPHSIVNTPASNQATMDVINVGSLDNVTFNGHTRQQQQMLQQQTPRSQSQFTSSVNTSNQQLPQTKPQLMSIPIPQQSQFTPQRKSFMPIMPSSNDNSNANSTINSNIFTVKHDKEMRSRLQEIEENIMKELENQNEEYKNFISDEIEKNVQKMNKNQRSTHSQNRRQQAFKLGAHHTQSSIQEQFHFSQTKKPLGNQQNILSLQKLPAMKTMDYDNLKLKHTIISEDDNTPDFSKQSKVSQFHPGVNQQIQETAFRTHSKIDTNSQSPNHSSLSESVSVSSSRQTQKFESNQVKYDMKATVELAHKMFRKPKERAYLKNLSEFASPQKLNEEQIFIDKQNGGQHRRLIIKISNQSPSQMSLDAQNNNNLLPSTKESHQMSIIQNPYTKRLEKPKVVPIQVKHEKFSQSLRQSMLKSKQQQSRESLNSVIEQYIDKSNRPQQKQKLMFRLDQQVQFQGLKSHKSQALLPSLNQRLISQRESRSSMNFKSSIQDSQISQSDPDVLQNQQQINYKHVKSSILLRHNPNKQTQLQKILESSKSQRVVIHGISSSSSLNNIAIVNNTKTQK
eukprot:403369483